MDPQNQNIQPDYSFITGQQAPPPPTQSKKKLLIIVALVLLALVLLLAVIAAMSKSATKRNQTKSNATAQVFLKAVGNQDYATAYATLSGGLQKATSQSAFEQKTKQAFSDLDISSCRQAEPSGNGAATSYTLYYCLHQDKKTYLRVKFTQDTNGLVSGVYVF